MRTTCAIPWLLLAWFADSCCAQAPPPQHVPWNQSFRSATALIDRHVLRETGHQFRRLTDNQDRVHLTIRFASNGGRLVQVAAPVSWGEEKTLACATEAARQLGWPMTARYVTVADESIIAGVAGTHHLERSWTETAPWPDLVGILRASGAARVELRVRTSGLPMTSRDDLRGWADAGNAAMEIRVRLCDATAPPPPMRLTVGFPPGFVTSRVVAGLTTVLLGFGALLGLYLVAMRSARFGKPVARRIKVLWGTAHLCTLIWLAQAFATRAIFVITLLRIPPPIATLLRACALFGPPALFYLFSSRLCRRLRAVSGTAPTARGVAVTRTMFVTVCAGIGVGLFVVINHGVASSEAFAAPDRLFKWLFPVVLVLNVVAWALVRWTRGQRRTLISGKLLDRCHSLAARAGVPVANVQIVDSRRARANGFATAGGGIMVTKPHCCTCRRPRSMPCSRTSWPT